MLTGRLLATGLAVVMAIGLGLLQARVIGNKKARDAQIGFALFLIAVVWTPRWLRDGLIALVVWLLLISVLWRHVLGALVLLLPCVGLVYGLRQVPGGGLALILGGVALGAFFAVRGLWRSLGRLARAASLSPGERPRGEVVVSGKVHREGERTGWPEMVPEDACLWTITGGDIKLRGELPVEIVTPQGVAVLHPRDARLQLGEKTLNLDAAQLVKLPGGPRKETAAVLHWVPEGATVCVIGTPVWEPGGRSAAMYRESPMVPVFRATAGQVSAHDRDETTLHREALSSLASWLGWGATAGVVAALQFLGVA